MEKHSCRKTFLFVLFMMGGTFLHATAFLVEFSPGETASYTLENVDAIVGGQGIVLFAKVDACSNTIAHKIGEVVVLKIAFEHSIEHLHKEREAYRRIVTKSEESDMKITWAANVYGLGTSTESRESDPKFTCFQGKEQKIYHILVMQRVGMTWGAYHAKVGGQIPKAVMLKFTKNLVKILGEMKLFGIAHGDLKPSNILMDANNDENGETFVVDFGLATVDDCEFAVEGSGGDFLLMSWAMFEAVIAQDPVVATEHDDAEMAVNALALLFSNYLPWLALCKNNTGKLPPAVLWNIGQSKEKFTMSEPEFDCIEKETRQILKKLLAAARESKAIHYASLL